MWLALELGRALGFHGLIVEDQILVAALLCRLDIDEAIDLALRRGWRDRLAHNGGRVMRALHLAGQARRFGGAEPWDDPEGAVLVAAWNLSEAGAGVVPETDPLIVRTPW